MEQQLSTTPVPGNEGEETESAALLVSFVAAPILDLTFDKRVGLGAAPVEDLVEVVETDGSPDGSLEVDFEVLDTALVGTNLR
ncbi:unnamed protein product [Bursaphelenchus okinawaensis]|uniref:Uncharacterized protein n=1 Tax=Bursaphelenchus okinawaensis TaxID=465554 RepID=A0A811KS57_9BILA|nr:unnamed protein product [Bursaphelenchus okinawaensis]CAG9109924.1 unnamed protein product [Bursaphelenchus okinawaensis]